MLESTICSWATASGCYFGGCVFMRLAASVCTAIMEINTKTVRVAII
jgi:hypothetical protein